MSRLYRPEHLDLSAVPKRFHEAILWLITTIIERRNRNRCLRKGFVPIARKRMAQVLGSRNVSKVLKYAQDMGLIESDRQYIVGEKPIGYRIGVRYRQSEVVRVQAKRERIKKAIRPQLKRKSIADGLIANQLSRDLRRLTIDDIDPTTLRDLAEQSKSEWENPFACYLMATDQIRDKHFWWKRDDYGRFHSNLTNLKSELRHFLNIEGERLVGVDINNSQPLCLGVLLKLISGESELAEQSELKDMITHYYDPSSMSPSFSLPASLSFSSIMKCTIDVSSSDIERWCKLVASGKVYEGLATEMGKRHTRKSAKAEWNLFAYGKPDVRRPLYKVFQREFPSILRFIDDVKRNNLLETKKHRLLAHSLQLVESLIVIDTICTRIKRESPDIRLLTIHDSILTTPKNLPVVEKEIRRAFGELEMEVGLKREWYFPDRVRKVA